MHCSEVVATVGTVNAAPTDERIRLGLKRSVRGSHTITASTPAASAERSTAPRLPGFSTLSSTTISGLSGSVSCSRLSSGVRTVAMMPSVVPR